MGFEKYGKSGAYHWRNVDLTDWRRFNGVVLARYARTMDLVPSHATRLLDIGCGDGYVVHELARSGKEVIGLDITMEGLRCGRDELIQHSDAYPRGIPRLVLGSAFHLPFAAGFFDGVVLSEVIEHVEEGGALLHEVHRVLAPGGTLIVSTPNRQPTGLRDRYHVFEYDPADLKAELAKCFRDVRVFGMGHIALLEFFKKNAKRSQLRQLVYWMCRLGFNPFEYPWKPATSRSNLLFAVCSK